MFRSKHFHLLRQRNSNRGIASTTFAIIGATTQTGTGYNASGAYGVETSTIVWTVTDASGNTGTCSSTVKVNPLPVAGIVIGNQDPFCNGLRLTGASMLTVSFTYHLHCLRFFRILLFLSG